ncbi:MAG: hypothetical protein KA116_05680 [Proteobacteria bacterium]|nr:hypothetical protein [Pseudomonadota bacterium]
MLPAPIRNFLKLSSFLLFGFFIIFVTSENSLAAKPSKMRPSRKAALRPMAPLASINSQVPLLMDTPEELPKSRQTPCANSLVKIARAIKPSNIRRLFSDLFYGYKGEDDFEWLGRVLKEDLKNTLKMRLNWAEYNYHPEKFKDRQAYWIQIGHLKELNKSWDVKTTEFALTMLNEELAKILDTTDALGLLVHQNYKDRVLLSKLSTDKFETEILKPLRKKFADRVRDIKPEPVDGMSWEDWAAEVLHYGSGPTLEYAHVDLKLKTLGYENSNYETVRKWRSRLEWAYRKLFGHGNLGGISKEEITKATRFDVDSVEGQVELAHWMGNVRIPLSRKPEIEVWLRDYRRAGSVGDFLPLDNVPTKSEVAEIHQLLNEVGENRTLTFSDIDRISMLLPKAWTVQRALFYFKSMRAGNLLFVDLKNFGLKAAHARNDWIEKGAGFKNLTSIYDETSAELLREFEQLTAALDIILETRLNYYASGDDAIFALPSMDARQAELVEAFLLKRGLKIHFYIQKIEKIGDPESVSEAINTGDAALTEKKQMYKDTMKPFIDQQYEIDALRAANK